MKVIETFKKQGGLQLIKQYWKSGALFSSIVEFLILGKSKTALEILRLSAQLKTKQKLARQYEKLLFKQEQKQLDLSENSENAIKGKIWVCWFQGLDYAPNLVKKCYASLQENIKDHEIVLITEQNYSDYVDFPDYINEKVKAGIISKTHLSDLLRLELLVRYGGTWIDATVFCASNSIPEYMLDSDLFLFQTLKPGVDGHSTWISNWFMTAKKENCILRLTLQMLYRYWRIEKSLIDYYVFHDFFQLAIETYPEQWHKVVPFSNSTSHILLLRLFDQYDDIMWQAIKNQTPFHKLSYKFAEEQFRLNNTFYSVLLRDNSAEQNGSEGKYEEKRVDNKRDSGGFIGDIASDC